jgi:hypothetical protein
MRGRLLLVALLASALAAGCFEWTEDPQGNLKSVGVPGVSVWKAKDQPTPSLSSEAVRDRQIADIDPETADLAAEGPANGAWIVELNRWRTMAGVGRVGENPMLTYESQQHARYLVKQGPTDNRAFGLYARALGGGAHREDPGSPYYTREGAEGARGGKIYPSVRQSADVAWGEKDEVDDIDGLLAYPFHRISLLAPWVEVAGYGSDGEYPRRVAALALRGKMETSMETSEEATPVEFPPNGATMPVGAVTRMEWPDPLASCPGYQRPTGLPITVQVGHLIEVESFSLKDETTGDKVEACAFDFASYSNPDPGQQSSARAALKRFGAAVLIPREPLTAGHRYNVEIKTHRHAFSWSFSIGGEAKAQRPGSA